MRGAILPLALGPVRVGRASSVGDAIVVDAAPRQRGAPCPDCRRRTRRVHSRYRRTVRDLPCGGVAVVLHLHVRRFICRNRRCPRRIFCERLPNLVKRHGRLTSRLEGALQHLGMALGGEAGARLAARLAMPVSPAGLRQLVRRNPTPDVPAGPILGIDDWARRKGRTYGTIVVDLEARRPVDLLPDRSVDDVAAWLGKHPGVRVISRDRGKEYIEGARRGAPAAVQVADRWHLLKILGDALERLFTRKPGWLRSAARTATDQQGGRPPTSMPPATPPTAAERDRAARRGRRLAQYAEVRALREQGRSLSAIAPGGTRAKHGGAICPSRHVPRPRAAPTRSGRPRPVPGRAGAAQAQRRAERTPALAPAARARLLRFRGDRPARHRPVADGGILADGAVAHRAPRFPSPSVASTGRLADDPVQR